MRSKLYKILAILVLFLSVTCFVGCGGKKPDKGYISRDDVTTYYVPATKMANDEGFSTLANMILMGKLMQVCDNVGYAKVEDAVKKVVPPRKANLIDVNLKAVKLGYEF